ncbi:Phage tail sheath protein subtilisin-like domain protein [anaerobic digester metagenome]
MPIGGGTLTVQNKILPGAYTNFVSTSTAASMGSRGTVALPLALNWGPENKIYSLAAGDFNQLAMKDLGYDPTAAELLLMREGLKRASTLLLYRVNSGGVKASATVGGLTVTAKYGGTRGNDIKAAILNNADSTSNVDVVTYIDGAEVDRQTVAKSGGAADLKATDYVTFNSPATLTAAAAVSLTGGTNGTVNGTAYTAWLNAVEVESFSVLGYPGTDASVKALVAAFVKRLREDEGKKIVGVLHDYTTADSIGIISVKNGVKLADGTTLTGDQAVAWVAGASAAAEINESLTNTAYDGAVDVDTKYTKSQYEAALNAGEFVFYADSGAARVLSDINCRTTFGGGISEDWTSNRVVRVMDGWANDTARIFGERYLGTQTNSETGRSLFQADLVSLAKEYEDIDAISDFVPDDITVQQGNGKRDVSVASALKPNDAMEKLYQTVQVN